MKRWKLYLLVFMGLAVLATSLLEAATITWSHTFSDGETLTAGMLETMKTDITTVVNAGGGPVGLTNSQTVSGDKTFSGTTTVSGAITFSSTLTATSAVIGGGSPLVFEGATADAFELTLALPDPTADVTYTISGSASVSSFIPAFQNDATDDVSLIFEGATADAFESTLTFSDPTADNAFTLPAGESITFGQQVVKGWGRITVSAGVPSLADSHNVSSVADGAAGQYDVTWTTAHANANYALVCSSDSATNGHCRTGVNTTTVGKMTTWNTGNTQVEVVEIQFIAIGDR